jgi:hypothetical protein
VVQDHVRTRESLLAHTGDLFGWLLDGTLAHRIGGRYPLADAARAHADVESSRTIGKLLLLPGWSPPAEAGTSGTTSAAPARRRPSGPA